MGVQGTRYGGYRVQGLQGTRVAGYEGNKVQGVQASRRKEFKRYRAGWYRYRAQRLNGTWYTGTE